MTEKSKNNKKNASSKNPASSPVTPDFRAPLSQIWGNQVDRQSLFQAIERWADETAQDKTALLVAGINRMFMFNEAFGMHVSDRIIEQTGVALRDLLGRFAYVCRVEGNAFGILLHDNAQHDMSAVARYILNYFHEVPLSTPAGKVTVSLSIGGVTIDREGTDRPADILIKAEAAMRAARERRFNGFVSYEGMADQTESYRCILAQGNAFLNALREKRVRLAYQPIIRARDGNVVLHECLIRMINEDGTICNAADFVPAIEHLGLSHLADQFALQTALQELIQYPDLSLSINVSHMSLHSPEWLAALESVLRNHKNVAPRLVVELTESAAMGDYEETVRIVSRLQELGCRIALDDFGAGYTAFSQIKDLNIDFLKIDKSYIRNIQDEKNRLFVKTLQMLADGLGIETIGEGAETEGDASLLTADGISNIQGYAYGLPLIERVWLPEDHAQRHLFSSSGDDDDI